MIATRASYGEFFYLSWFPGLATEYDQVALWATLSADHSEPDPPIVELEKFLAEGKDRSQPPSGLGVIPADPSSLADPTRAKLLATARAFLDAVVHFPFSSGLASAPTRGRGK